jgi:hypothetical protein
MNIAVILPAAFEGKPYRECIQLNGTQPFVLVKSNLDGIGSASIIGSTLCVYIEAPSSAIDLAVEVKGGCKDCETVTFSGQIGFIPKDTCTCTPVTIAPQVVPPLVNGALYHAIIELSGTAPFELCGGSAPQCLSIELSGSFVIVSGRYNGVGSVVFSVKNACTCDCVSYRIGVV